MLATSLFDYELPPELIARYPAAHRDGSRMMVLDRKTGHAEIHPFTDIVDYLSSGDASSATTQKSAGDVCSPAKQVSRTVPSLNSSSSNRTTASPANGTA